MKRYQHIFFDLDNTLWDFHRCSNETLEELFQEYELYKLGDVTKEMFTTAFQKVNREFWHRYDCNEIDKKYIREKRFGVVFQEIGLPDILTPPTLSDTYLDRCPKKGYLVENTLEVLNYLKGKYQLHILTNGFNEPQEKKMKYANLGSFFQTVVTSESCAYKKPEKGVFTYAMNQANAKLEESVMIGDSLMTDIKGAEAVGMDSIYFNPKQVPHSNYETTEIQSLKELLEMF